MRLRSMSSGLLLLASVGASPLEAASVLVPDDFPTLQGAFDAITGADTIRVRPGRYFERPRFNHSVVLLAADPNAPRPRFDGLVIYNDSHVHLRVRDIAFEGPVDLHTPGRDRGNTFAFDHCTLDSGLYQRENGDIADIGLLAVRNSRVRGSIHVNAEGPVCESDTIEAGGVGFAAEGQPVIRDCRFIGPGEIAINIGVETFRGEIARNEIIGPYTTGIQVHNATEATVRDNRVSSCIRGINLAGDVTTVTGNYVKDCGTGIRWLGAGLSVLADNHVLGSVADGILLEDLGTELVLERNIVGRSGGHGIGIDINYEYSYFPAATLISNTTYDNGGSGFAVSSVRLISGPLALDVRRNIGYGNGAYGFKQGADVTVTLGCNDWFANDSGSVVAGLPPDDFELDPWFCDVDHDSIGLEKGSPLVAMEGCGLIGARGAACATTATQVQMFLGEWDGAGIELSWILSEEPEEVALERTDRGSEAWQRISISPTRVGVMTVVRDPGAEPGHSYRYRLAWRATSGEWARSEPVEVIAGAATAAFALHPISPNPAAGPLRVQWSMPRAGDVDLRVFDPAGREMATLAKGWFDAGRHALIWDAGESGHRMAAGIYFVRLRSGENSATATVLIRR